MLFALTCQDRPGALEARLAARPDHLEYLAGRAASVLLGGPVLDAAGDPCGSVLVIDVPDQAAAEAFAAADPYALRGVFGSVTVRPFRMVFRDGARVG